MLQGIYPCLLVLVFLKNRLNAAGFPYILVLGFSEIWLNAAGTVTVLTSTRFFMEIQLNVAGFSVRTSTRIS